MCSLQNLYIYSLPLFFHFFIVFLHLLSASSFSLWFLIYHRCRFPLVGLVYYIYTYIFILMFLCRILLGFNRIILIFICMHITCTPIINQNCDSLSFFLSYSLICNKISLLGFAFSLLHSSIGEYSKIFQVTIASWFLPYKNIVINHIAQPYIRFLGSKFIILI